MALLNGEKVNNAKIPLLEPYGVAGVDPKTGKRVDDAKPSLLKSNIRRQLRINDLQAAVTSIKWFNLPNGVTADIIERILYYRGQGMFFYMKEDDKFLFLPYALDGNIDVYGRFTRTTPLPFNGTAVEGDKEKVKPWVAGLNRKCYYDIVLEQLTPEEIMDSCVLLHDYTCQVSQTNISRQIVNEAIVDLEAEMFPFARTALLNATGVSAMRVNDEDEQSNVAAASAMMNKAALVGQKFIAVTGKLDFQELTGGQVAKSQEYLMTMQSIDNYRLSLHGVDSGGIFQKQSHMLESENQMNASKSSFAMQDRLMQRQHFCDIVNSIFGLGIWCDVSEPAAGFDANMDGELYSNEPDTTSYSSEEVSNGSEE